VRIIRALMLALALPVAGHCGKPLVAEAPVEACADAFVVALTSYSWTAVPSSNCAGRTKVYLNTRNTNTGTARCIGTSSSSAPSSSTTTFAVWEAAPSANAIEIPASDKLYLWCLTSHTAAENISGIEVKQ
jgi:hypothetical protein